MIPLLPLVAGAQPRMPDGPHRHVAVHPLVGALVPTGSAGDALTAGPLAGAQLGVTLPRWWGPRAALVATAFGARARLRAPGTFDRRGVAVFGYDLGLEFSGRLTRFGEDAHASRLVPFLGVGAGGRTFKPDASRAPSRTGGTAYLSLGGELGRGRTTLRLDGRAYGSRLDPRGRTDAWRGEIVGSAGLAYHFR